jgi:glycosyltransferase involved in cell wall biosynthesis
MTPVEETTVVGVVIRDRFSMFDPCISAIRAYTDAPFRLVVVVGGADSETTQYLRAVQAGLAGTTLVVTDDLLLQGQARNLVLRHSKGRFCAILENDTIVHRNWLRPLLQCIEEESAAVVAPLIHDLRSPRIHAAGGHFEEVQTKGGIALRHRIGRQGMRVSESPVKRCKIGYPENHCILLDRMLLSEDDLFDDVEPFDVDLGLTLRQRGLSAFLEPDSVVTYADPPPLQVRDIEAFKYRWDFSAWAERNRRFTQKWRVSYDNRPKELSYRRQQLRLGLAKWWPTEANVRMANIYMGLLKGVHARMRLPWAR